MYVIRNCAGGAGIRIRTRSYLSGAYRVGNHYQVELSPNEKILDYSTGFTGGWELTRRENVFYLKPKNVDVDTNMMIRTATHSYILELKVVATDWQRLEQAKQAGVQYKVLFTYPRDTSFNGPEDAAAVKEGPQLNAKILKDRRYYYDYDYSTRTKSLGLSQVGYMMTESSPILIWT